ncbi:hypothetical protein EDB80DRAFT_540102, partial [Ilyonectria destructans]
SRDKSIADTQRKREKRQKVTAEERGVPYSNFCNLHLPSFVPSQVDRSHHPIQHQDNTESSLATELDSQEISNFLPPPSPPLQPTTKEIFLDDGEPSGAVSIPSSSVVGEDDTTTPTADSREASTPCTIDHQNRVQRLASELADQLTLFRGCCVDCHRTAKRQHNEDLVGRTSLPSYL